MKPSKNHTIESILKDGTLLYSFPVLSRGKDADPIGHIYTMPDKRRYIILTNQGEHYIARPGELLSKITEYEEAHQASEAALRLYYSIDESSLH